MKLIHPHFSIQIDFDKNDCYSLVIENSREFYEKTSELFRQSNGDDGNFVLSENIELDISKACLYIYDFYSDTLNNKKTITSINKKVIDILKSNDFVCEFNEINKLFININDSVLEQLDYNIEYADNLDYDTFVKFSSYKIKTDNSLLENLLSYIQIFVQNEGKILLIFVNLFSVLEKSEIELLIKQLRYMQLKVLLIDSHQKYKVDDIETIIIDDDLCII